MSNMRIKFFCFAVDNDGGDVYPLLFKTRAEAETAHAAEDERCGDIYEVRIRTDVDGNVIGVERWSDEDILRTQNPRVR